MNLIVCIENNGGLAFNGRRLSRDRAVAEDILNSIKGARLFIAPYSKTLFKTGEYISCQDYLLRAGADDCCFVEREDIAPYLDKTEKMILYKWNRDYPFDLRFDSGILDRFILTEITEFAGYSHEKITKEVYIKC